MLVYANRDACRVGPQHRLVQEQSAGRAHQRQLRQATNFDVAYSTDGFNLSYLATVDCSAVVSGSNASTWASDLFIDSDGSLHVFFAASNTGMQDTGFQVYGVHPTTYSAAGLPTAWSTPVVVTGSGFSSNMVDPTIEKVGSTYYLWYKHETSGQKYICYATSTSLTSGYTAIETGN